MPRRVAEHDGGVGGIQRLVHELDRFVENQLVHLLAARIDRLQLARELRRFLRILGEQQAQTVVRIADAPGRIKSGGKNKAHVRSTERLAAEPRSLDQGTQTDPARVRELLEAVADQDAVLAHEGDNVRDCGKRHVIEKVQRQVGREAEHFDERLRELEGDARTAEVLVLRLAVGSARVEHGVRGGQLVARQVMIGDDDVDARGSGGSHGFDRGDPAVARDDQPCANALRLPQPCRPEVVAVADPVRHEGMHRRAGAAQNAREHGRGALAVHVVIAVHQDRPLLADRTGQQLERDIHVGPAVRVGQALEIGAQESFGELGGPEAALHQNGRKRVRNAQLRRQHARRVRVGLSRDNPAW